MYRDYLRVPCGDLAKVMTTPPLSALGPDAQTALPPLELEEAPRPEDLTSHDLSTPPGMVPVSDGTYVGQEEARGVLEMEGWQRGFRVTRRKIIHFHPQTPSVVIDLYEQV